MRRPSLVPARRTSLGASLLAVLWASLCGLAVVACGSTLEEQPVAANTLESLIAAREYPVYWLGNSFQHLGVSEVSRDSGGAYTVQYGSCVSGGQLGCAAALKIVTSPENSFVAHGPAGLRTVPMRAVDAFVSNDGQTVEIPTGAVVVSVRADSAALAHAAARAIVPINPIDGVGLPAAPLPKPLPATDFATDPLPSQLKTSASKTR
jgi:hypothetical protein